MKFLFKVILVFLIVFKFPVPHIYDSCTVAIVMAALYYLFVKGSFPYTYFTSRYCFTILVFTLFMAFFDLVNTSVHGYVGTGLFNRFIVQGWMFICVLFVLPILIEKEENAYHNAITIICSAFALQGLIHLLAYLITPFGEFILSITHNWELRTEDNPVKFRYYSLTGSPFFEMQAAYGVACIMFFRLQLIPDQNYLRGWKAFVIMTFMILGIILSGRTGFIGLGLGLLFYLVYTWNNFSQIWKNIVKIAGGFICLMVIYFTALPPQQQNKFTDNVFPFAFEAYFNWRDRGTFSTGSTDQLNKVHYYSLEANTILWGEGGWSRQLSYKFYPTDAGYMEHLILGGIFYLLALILYQLVFLWQPMKIAKRENSRSGDINFFCFFLLFAHMFILEYKGNAIGAIHIVETLLLYIGISYLVEQYALEDIKETQEEGLHESAYA